MDASESTSAASLALSRQLSACSAASQVDQAEIVKQLSHEVRKLETAGRTSKISNVTGTGSEVLDACLPAGGYVLGSVIEYLRTTPACGASYLALAAAAAAMKTWGGFLVIVDPLHAFYPPALAGHGMDLQRVIFVRPQSLDDALWATDQALRTPAVTAVVAEIDRFDDRAARRLQLAAEQGDGLGLLLRDMAARRGPSWAEVQWLVHSVSKAANRFDRQAATRLQTSGAGPGIKQHSLGRRLKVELVRNRGGQAGAVAELWVNGITGKIDAGERERHEPKTAMRLATELASPKSPSRRAAAG